jgi:3-hydroxyisobutyrate dehydrogenase
MKVGFIGLGTMGAYMAANLSKYLESSNHGLVVHDVRREAAEAFLAKGAQWAESPRRLPKSVTWSFCPCRARRKSKL